jgi:hypothetical protein
MMNWSDLPWRPASRTLRQFAGLWLVFFAALSCWHGLVEQRWALGLFLAGLAVTIGPLGLLWPQAVRPLFVGWTVLVFPIGWTISHLVLALVYYGLFTPVGLLMRLAGRDPLALRRPALGDTCWRAKPQPRDIHSYLRQF